jgi:hypothetical protein
MLAQILLLQHITMTIASKGVSPIIILILMIATTLQSIQVIGQECKKEEKKGNNCGSEESGNEKIFGSGFQLFPELKIIDTASQQHIFELKESKLTKEKIEMFFRPSFRVKVRDTRTKIGHAFKDLWADKKE